MAKRYERGGILITTNQLVTQWGTVFGDEVLAAAILDRLLHHRYTVMVQGESGKTCRQDYNEHHPPRALKAQPQR